MLKPKRLFTDVGLVLTMTLLLYIASSFGYRLIASTFQKDAWINSSELSSWLSSCIPVYFISLPISGVFLNRIPRQRIKEQQQITFKQFVKYMVMCFPLMYFGSIIGVLFSGALFGDISTNPVTEVVKSSTILRLVFAVIIAPVFEEWFFRKKILDALSDCDEKNATIFSALAFALFHLNFYQFFYAFGVGLIFAYVYLKTGRVRYSIAMHISVNFLGSIVAPLVLKLIDLDALEQIDILDINGLLSVIQQMMPGFLIYMIYACILFTVAIVGAFMLYRNRESICFLPAAESTDNMHPFIFLKSAGVVVYIVFCISAIVYFS